LLVGDERVEGCGVGIRAANYGLDAFVCANVGGEGPVDVFEEVEFADGDEGCIDDIVAVVYVFELGKGG